MNRYFIGALLIILSCLQYNASALSTDISWQENYIILDLEDIYNIAYIHISSNEYSEIYATFSDDNIAWFSETLHVSSDNIDFIIFPKRAEIRYIKIFATDVLEIRKIHIEEMFDMRTHHTPKNVDNTTPLLI